MRYKKGMIFKSEKESQSYFQIFWRWALWSIAFGLAFLIMAELLRISLSGSPFLADSYLLQKVESVLPVSRTYSGSTKLWSQNEIWNLSAIDLQCHSRGQACLRRWDGQSHTWLPTKLEVSSGQPISFFQSDMGFIADQALTWPLLDESSKPWVVLASIGPRDPMFHHLGSGKTQNSAFFESMTDLSLSQLEQLSQYLFFIYDSQNLSNFTALQVSQIVDCSKDSAKCGQEGVSFVEQNHVYWFQFSPAVDVSHLIPQVPEGLYKFSTLQQGFGLFPLGLEKHHHLLSQSAQTFGKFLDIVQWKVEKNFGSSDYQLIQKSLLNQDLLPMRKNIGSYGAVIAYQPKTQQWSLDLLADQITSDLQMPVKERFPLEMESHYLASTSGLFQSPIYFHQPEKGGVFWTSEASSVRDQDSKAKFVWGLRWKRKFAKTDDQIFIPLSYIDLLEEAHESTKFRSLDSLEVVAPSELFHEFSQQLKKVAEAHSKDFVTGELSFNIEGQLCEEWLYRPLVGGTQVYQLPKVFFHLHDEGIRDPTQVLGIRSGMQVISWNQEFQRLEDAENFQEVYEQLSAWSKFEWRIEAGQDIPLISLTDRGSHNFKNKAFQKALQLSKRPTEENWISFLAEMDPFQKQLCDSQENWIWDLWPMPQICKMSHLSVRRFSSYISPVMNFDLFKTWLQKQLILHMALEWQEQLDFQFRSGILPVQRVECRQPVVQNLNWKNQRPDFGVNMKSIKENFHSMETMVPEQWTWIFKNTTLRGSHE